MKQLKRDFPLKACVLGFRGWGQKEKNQLFQNMVMVHIK